MYMIMYLGMIIPPYQALYQLMCVCVAHACIHLSVDGCIILMHVCVGRSIYNGTGTGTGTGTGLITT
mgnify:CR=1 FL=1